MEDAGRRTYRELIKRTISNRKNEDKHQSHCLTDFKIEKKKGNCRIKSFNIYIVYSNFRVGMWMTIILHCLIEQKHELLTFTFYFRVNVYCFKKKTLITRNLMKEFSDIRVYLFVENANNIIIKIIHLISVSQYVSVSL